MNDFLDTIIPYGKIITKKVKNKFDPCLRFKENSENNKSIHHMTKRYESKINEALAWTKDMQEVVDYILETLTKLVNIYNLKDETDKEIIFDQITIFMNYLCLKLRSKFLFNALTKNDLRKFNEGTIWDNINNLSQKWWNHSNSWCYCVHYALFYKKVFDELEKRINLWTSNYLFLEKGDWANHSWLVATFNWKNYLVDSSYFNRKFIQPIDDVWEFYNRMESLKDFHKEDILYDSVKTVEDDYIEHDIDYYKVKLKSAQDLLDLLDSVPRKIWNISRMYNILGNTLWVNLKISKEWIQILKTFIYYFDHIINKEELDNISDDELMDYLINSISYKTDKNNTKKIKVFNFEKNYIKDTLYYFSDKIDYSILRKVLSNA